MFARLVHGIAASTFLFFGVAYFVAPERMIAVVGLVASSSTAIADVRSVYGALELGIAGLLFWALAKGRVREGLIVSAILFACLGFGRLFGSLLEGELTATTLRIIGGELFGALGCVVALATQKRSA